MSERMARIETETKQLVFEGTESQAEPEKELRAEFAVEECGTPGTEEFVARGMPVHSFGREQVSGDEIVLDRTVENSRQQESGDEEFERRTYRGRTVAMLRRYMRYSMETGRLPSVLGREFFRAKVTSYTVVTFEDRVIFVHDMESCLDRLDEFSRQLIARHVLQEHDRWATARLLQCNEKTVRRLTPLALDQLSEIMLDMGLMERIGADAKISCQGGGKNKTSASCWQDAK
jgi:DNA-directed RNA polymerase specialized sigma24 family protein